MLAFILLISVIIGNMTLLGITYIYHDVGGWFSGATQIWQRPRFVQYMCGSEHVCPNFRGKSYEFNILRCPNAYWNTWYVNLYVGWIIDIKWYQFYCTLHGRAHLVNIFPSFVSYCTYYPDLDNHVQWLYFTFLIWKELICVTYLCDMVVMRFYIGGWCPGWHIHTSCSVVLCVLYQ